jgi:hypothetical protein
MTKEEYLRLAETKWPELEQLKAAGDFYAYEKRFAEIWFELGRAVLESSVSEIPADRRKKKVPNPVWTNRNSQQQRFQ